MKSRLHTLNFLALMSVLILSACASKAPTPWDQVNTTSARPAAAPVAGSFDWGWDVAGDPQVRPVQVFSNGAKTWLQMKPHQVMPALFVDGAPIPFAIEPPYLVVSGNPAKIDVIASSYRSVVLRKTKVVEEAPLRSVDVTRVQRSVYRSGEATTPAATQPTQSSLPLQEKTTSQPKSN